MDCTPPGSYCLWDSPGKNMGAGCHFLLQGVFLTQGSNPVLLHWQSDSLSSEPPGKPVKTYSSRFSHSVESDSCNPMNRSTPGLPVYQQLPEFTQTHVHRVGDAIQPSHPLSSPSPAPNPSQHQGLLQWVNSSHEVARVLEFQPQRQSFQSTPRTGLLQDGLVGSPCSPRDSQESSPTPQFVSHIKQLLFKDL